MLLTICRLGSLCYHDQPSTEKNCTSSRDPPRCCGCWGPSPGALRRLSCSRGRRLKMSSGSGFGVAASRGMWAEKAASSGFEDRSTPLWACCACSVWLWRALCSCSSRLELSCWFAGCREEEALQMCDIAAPQKEHHSVSIACVQTRQIKISRP